MGVGVHLEHYEGEVVDTQGELGDHYYFQKGVKDVGK